MTPTTTPRDAAIAHAQACRGAVDADQHWPGYIGPGYPPSYTCRSRLYEIRSRERPDVIVAVWPAP